MREELLSSNSYDATDISNSPYTDQEFAMYEAEMAANLEEQRAADAIDAQIQAEYDQFIAESNAPAPTEPQIIPYVNRETASLNEARQVVLQYEAGSAARKAAFDDYIYILNRGDNGEETIRKDIQNQNAFRNVSTDLGERNVVDKTMIPGSDNHPRTQQQFLEIMTVAQRESDEREKIVSPEFQASEQPMIGQPYPDDGEEPQPGGTGNIPDPIPRQNAPHYMTDDDIRKPAGEDDDVWGPGDKNIPGRVPMFFTPTSRAQDITTKEDPYEYEPHTGPKPLPRSGPMNFNPLPIDIKPTIPGKITKPLYIPEPLPMDMRSRVARGDYFLFHYDLMPEPDPIGSIQKGLFGGTYRQTAIGYGFESLITGAWNFAVIAGSIPFNLWGKKSTPPIEGLPFNDDDL